MSLPLLQIITGSTRPGRAGAAVASWFADHARTHGGFEVELVDLAEVDLPMFDEPNHPMTGNYVNEHTRRWSARVSRAQAYVLVTPEYNNGYPAVLKNALDYLNREWRHKAVGFVSYGGVSAGTRATGQLKQVVTTLRMVPVQDAVHIPFIAQHLGEDGTFQATDAVVASAKKLLDELLLVGTALLPLHAPVTTDDGS
ncbi:NADPH-dependent FMN reductase [Streptosporangium amethystogenes]|uniref:NADPH-dependent FMN reductase n=1 Tax=Streptosporangium amethystogenes TaxID=2002 RepID=UPI0036216451